jgi:hypothetical protein
MPEMTEESVAEFFRNAGFCPKCEDLKLAKTMWPNWKPGSGNFYSYNGKLGTYVWDVEKVLEIVNTVAREKTQMPPHIMLQLGMACLREDAVEPCHVDHVDETFPGVCTQIIEDGEPVSLLLDGRHRLFKVMNLDRPRCFEVYWLTEEEEKACRLLPGPVSREQADTEMYNATKTRLGV